MTHFTNASALTLALGLLLTAGSAAAQAPAAENPLGSLARNDRNGDGKVTAEEFASTRPGLVKRIDKNNDKSMTAEEVTAYYVTVAPLEDPKTAARIKGIMGADTDGDGKVSAAEMAAHDLADFKKRDKNGDGFITPEDRKPS